MLNLKIDSIKSSPKYDSCKKLIEKIKSTVCEIEHLKSDPENFIYEYFEEIKRKVDLRREVLLLEIDDYSNKIIHDIEKIKAECYELSRKVNNITVDIQTSKDELNDLCHDFGSFSIDDQKYENTSEKIEILKPKFEDSLDKYKNFLLKDVDYFVDHKEISIEDIFGKFSIREKVKKFFYKFFYNSRILNNQDQIDLTNLCKFPIKQNWKLAYRASADGFGADNFHSKCNGIINTLTIVKTTNGNILGGYTDETWESKDKSEYKRDHNAFIFSLKNGDNFPLKAECKHYNTAIWNYKNRGPIFGGGDIRICSNSNINNMCYSRFGHCYTHPNYPRPSYILAGTPSFQTTEIEVYYKYL